MESVGVRGLQQNASEIIRRAAAGEVVEVTDRGRPVARLVPYAASPLDALVSAGHARRATMRPSALGVPLPGKRGRPSLSRLLDEARAAER